MPTICKPAVAFPEHVITMPETLELATTMHAEHPRINLALQLIRNTGITKRHLVRPIGEILAHPGLEKRNAVYELEAKQRVPEVVVEALHNADVVTADIDAMVVVSCTGFLMPSLTAWLINTMNFRDDTVQIPIAQLGCAAGTAAINRAHDFCVARPGTNVLIVACEFCSLCYQPDDTEVGNLLSNGLFGDGIAAAVVRGRGGDGMRLENQFAYLLRGTERWIAYDLTETGFHFRLNKGVPGTMKAVAPIMQREAKSWGRDLAELDFYVIHTGGPKVLNDLSKHAGVAESAMRHSRDTLTNCGNIASAAVFDVLRRVFEDPSIRPGAAGVIAGFGPGITAEVAFGTRGGDRP